MNDTCSLPARAVAFVSETGEPRKMNWNSFDQLAHPPDPIGDRNATRKRKTDRKAQVEANRKRCGAEAEEQVEG